MLSLRNSKGKENEYQTHNPLVSIWSDISKFLPSYKNIGNAEKTYICTPNTLCFNSPKQFYKYYGLLKSRSECVCEDGFKK